MALLHVTDADTGDIVEIDTTNPTGSLSVIDANTGDIVTIDLSNPAGVLYLSEADTGDLESFDYSNPAGNLGVVDANTGDIVTIDLANPTGSFYVTDADTGDLVLIDLSSDGAFSFNQSLLLLNLDRTPPTIIITSTEVSPSPTLPIPVAFSLSEVSTDFTASSLTLSNCTVADFTGSGMSYSCNVTPTTPNATFTINVAANAFHDEKGNGNTAATQFSFTSNTFKLIDLFTTNQAAPITSPRTCEPGPGTLVIFDTGVTKRVSITGNLLQVDSPPEDYLQTAGRSSSTFTRITGKALHGLVSDVWLNAPIGWGTTTTPDFTIEAGVWARGNAVASGASVSQAITSGDVLSILRAVGSFEIVRATAGNYKLIWVSNTGSSANLYAKWGGGNSTWKLDDLKIAQLSAPWNTEYGIATNRLATPSVNDTTTSIANALIEMTWTATTNAVWNLMVRRTDDNNCWIVRCDQAAGTIKLFRKQSGVETEFDAGKTQTWTNGTAYRLVVYQDGNTIKTWVNETLKHNYQSASFNSTATGVKTDQAGTNLVTWPFVISGAALTSLQRVFP